MDKRAPDFGADLSSLASDVALEVGDVLDALRRKKESGRPTAIAVAKQAEPAEPDKHSGTPVDAAPQATNPGTTEPQTPLSEPSSNSPRKQRASPRPRTRASEEEEVVLQNVTTRLRRETNELLTEAALRQKLKKAGPDSRQDIIEAALQLWFREEGYG